MSLLMNILWLVLGGVVTAVEYIVGSVAMMITIIGIPFGIQTLKIGLLCLCPFGKRVEASPQSGGCLSLIMNILWIVTGGIWISLTHFGFGILLCITIIGIPFGKQHFKLAGLALTPFGKQIIEK
ncbi:MAG: YccF domain-containing protein [Bacteroidaceae bacterium]|nr:YccF domain-containing protein [Bacteroidaceae bacterium]MBR5612620.1 YccF domain-containing protein [Bacteroidaceae bacterium]